MGEREGGRREGREGGEGGRDGRKEGMGLITQCMITYPSIRAQNSSRPLAIFRAIFYNGHPKFDYDLY